MMRHVPGDDSICAGRGNPHTDVAGGVAVGGLEPDLAIDAMIRFHEVRETGIQDWGHRILHHRAEVILLRIGRPGLPLLARKQIAGIGKGRHPTPSHPHGVPTDMVDVQVGTDHVIDGLAGEAGRRKILQEWSGTHRPGLGGALLVIADTGIDQDAQPPAFDHQGVDRHLQPALVGDEVRGQPADLRQTFGQGVGEDEGAGNRGVLLDDLGDPDIADLPMRGHGLLPTRRCGSTGRRRPAGWYR